MSNQERCARPTTRCVRKQSSDRLQLTMWLHTARQRSAVWWPAYADHRVIHLGHSPGGRLERYATWKRASKPKIVGAAHGEHESSQSLNNRHRVLHSQIRDLKCL
ncbi:hypothetical protein CEXT_287031 [Caerostris extrusa]|uniref:Uncharacterized protein n=1 Tax=Caerostris extrusa TaxID=172846 RepID=A0AAV4SPM2_CAEEX|nr:hypothetical protein CEXT_287031 [Caerostris extrusa]